MHRDMLARFLSALALTFMCSAVAVSEEKPIDVELKNFKFKVPAEQEALFGLNDSEGKLFFLTNGKAEAAVKLPADGEYEIVVKASCDKALAEFAKFKLWLDGELVGKETTLTAEEPKEYKLTTKGKAGERKLAIEFTNDAYKEGEYDRNLHIHAVTIKKVK